MKTFKEFLNEARQKYIFGGTDDRNINVCSYDPKDRDELEKIIVECLEQDGPGANLNMINVSSVTDFSHLFHKIGREYGGNPNQSELYVDVSKWDTSNATDMSWMFCNCVKFNVDISKWDTSNVTNMKAMFYNASGFNKDLPGWDTSNVTDMSFMFKDAQSFNGDITTWDTSNVKNMFSMFEFAYNFNQDISKWDTSKVTNMERMFCYAKSFKQDLSKWNVSKVVQKHGVFTRCPIKKEYKPQFV